MRKNSLVYRQNQHSVGLATVHLIWVPKRQKPGLKGDIKLRLSEILDSVANDREWIIKAKEIAPDHVHLLVAYVKNTYM
jgi:putative transposase